MNDLSKKLTNICKYRIKYVDENIISSKYIYKYNIL